VNSLNADAPVTGISLGVQHKLTVYRNLICKRLVFSMMISVFYFSVIWMILFWKNVYT